MSADSDYYRILRVQPDAPAVLIHTSYRALLQQLKTHPAAGLDAALLDEAFAVLGDPLRRAAYDAQRDFAVTQVLPHTQTKGAGERTATFTAAFCLFCGTPHGLQGSVERDDDCRQCGSPLCPAERHRLEYLGQRMLRRIPKRSSIELYVAWPQAEPLTAEMRDVSLNGMLFVATVRLEANQIVKIDGPELIAIARVAHCERDHASADRWSTGIEFLTLRFRHSRGSFVSARV
jgi:hypothetical protein